MTNRRWGQLPPPGFRPHRAPHDSPTRGPEDDTDAVRSLRRELDANPVLAALAVTFMMLGAGLATVAARGPTTADPAPVLRVEADHEVSAAADEPAQRRSDSTTGVPAAVAGFGLLALWIVAGGVALRRSAHRRAFPRAGHTREDEGMPS